MLSVVLGSIVLCGVASVVIGFLWYSPLLFGATWMRLVNMSPEMAERGKKKMPLMAFFGLLASMLVAYVMTYVNAAWGFTQWTSALQLGFWCWAGFVAPTMVGGVLWEQRSFKLYLIDVLYWLVVFLVMAQIIVFTYSLNVGAAGINTSATDDSSIQYAAE